MSEFRIPSSNQSVPPSPLPILSTVSEEQNTTQTCLQDSSSISEANSILPSNSPVDHSGDDFEKVGVQIKQSLASIFLNLFTSSSEDKEDPLVERLAARIMQQIPNSPTLLEKESIGFYKCMLREALKYFPPRNPEASEDEILMDMFNSFAKRGWRVMADNLQKCSPEGPQIAQLANIVSKIDPHVDGVPLKDWTGYNRTQNQEKNSLWDPKLRGGQQQKKLRSF